MVTPYHCYLQRKLLQHPERSGLLIECNLWWARFLVQDLGERGVIYVRTVIANYLCASNVVTMGAKVVASGVLCVAGKDAVILSVVVAITVINISLKCRLVKFGRVAIVASSLCDAFRVATNLSSSLFLFTGPCRFEQHSSWCRGNTPCSLPFVTHLKHVVISAREYNSKKHAAAYMQCFFCFAAYRTGLHPFNVFSVSLELISFFF